MSEHGTVPVDPPHPVPDHEVGTGHGVAPDPEAVPPQANGQHEPPAEHHAPAEEAPAAHEPEPEHPAEPVVEAHAEAAEGEVAEEEATPEESPAEEAAEEAPPENRRHWYVVKVQSGREDTIKEAIERRVRKEGLEDAFGQIVIPVEKVTEVKVDKNGKRVPKTKERKLYPGYLMVEVEYNDRIVYLFRETSGVGDFVGAHPSDLMKPPTAMSEREVQRMLGSSAKPGDKDAPTVAPPPKWLQEGDRVRVVDGVFNGMDGTVKHILESVSKVQVELSIFGRPVNADFEYYQVEQV